jgi:anti-sigma factor RsiW
MNCAECQELLVAYLEELLEDSQNQAVEEHVKECEICQAELKGLQTLQHRLVDNGKALAQSDLEDQVMNRIIREQSARLKSAVRAGMVLRLRRLIMKSATVKIAVAAAVVLACAGGFYLVGGTRNVALADVLNKVEQVPAYMYRMTMHIKGGMPGMSPEGTDMTTTALIANDYGARMDVHMTDPITGQPMDQQIYLLPAQKMMMMILPGMKKYTRMSLDDSMFEQMKKQNNDPRIMIQQILACKYEELGKSVIDGVAVQGFRTTDPAYAGGTVEDVDVKVWVDVKTWLPVRVEMNLKVNEQMEMRGTLHDFQWDVPVSAAEFTPALPADYTAGPGDGLKVPPMSEQTALEGLKLCLDLFGKYPENLNIATLVQMLQELQEPDKSKTPAAQKLRQTMEQAKTDEERTQAMITMMPLQMLGAFYMSLGQEKKEPAYYGKVAQPGDIAQVLLRWKTGENEYRVIFADLHAETVDADTLAKLEAALPKQGS